jgi:hypothetical protein
MIRKEWNHMQKRACHLLYIAQLIIQGHYLQRNPVVFLPRNREKETKSYIKQSYAYHVIVLIKNHIKKKNSNRGQAP